MNRPFARMLAAVLVLAAMAGCTITNPTPYAHGLLQPGFNKAWNNAIDAMKDEGVQVVTADLASGRLEGRRGGVTVTARVLTQALGKVTTEFAAPQDPALAQRIQQRHAARMAQ